MSKSHQNRLAKLIKSSGGDVQGQYVIKPGVQLIMKTEVTSEASRLFEMMNIDSNRPSYEQAGEFASRLTYMSFRDEKKDSEEYNRKMVEEFGHMSVHSCHNVTFLIAGVTVETCLELNAHSEASVARLTSSRTKAQDQPMYRLVGSPTDHQVQRSLLEEAQAALNRANLSPSTLDEREWVNRLHPGAKVTALTYTMRVKDFHKTFIGRLSHHGVEAEMREVCEVMCRELHELYPLVVKSPEWYYKANNAEKYFIND